MTAERPEPDDEETVVMSRGEVAPDSDADDDATVLRPRATNAAPAAALDGAADDDDTVVTGRRAEDDDATVVTGRRVEDDDATVVMGRRADDDGDDDTAVMARDGAAAAADDDATVVSRRRATDDDATVVTPRTGGAGAAARAPHSSAPDPAPPRRRTKPVMSAPTKRRRRGLHPAPVPSGYGERAIRAAGAGAVSTYRAREIPRPPAVQPLGVEAPTIERITDGTPSVRRASRRFARGAVAGFAASCVVSVVGLALIVRVAFGL